MYDEFELPVMHKSKELFFPAQLQQWGYSHRFRVDVFGSEIFFEPDEEKSYRALVNPDNLNPQITPDLLQAIAESIETIVR